MYHLIKSSVKSILDQYYRIKVSHELEQAKKKAEIFEFDLFREQILNYCENQKNGVTKLFSFSENNNETDIYSNTYALMTYGLLGAIDSLNVDHALEYIYNHQSEDGLFRDEKLQCELAETGQGWGWHHLAPHIIIAFGYFKEKPKYDFNKVIDQFSKNTMSEWLSTLDWEDNYLMTSNQIMNVGVMLQYSRDYFINDVSKRLIDEMKAWLINEKFDKKTIIKNVIINRSKYEISKAVKAIYHIAPLFIYDGDSQNLPIESILKYALLTQNKIGGYGSNIITDACEDIDSLYLLTQLDNNTETIQNSVNRFFDYVFINQNQDDYGFLFKKYKSFSYGRQRLLSSNYGTSNMFATWFRSLSIAYACEFLNIPENFHFSDMPGYHYLEISN